MGYIDIHSHILQGVDDGSQSVEQSLEMLKIAAKQGITKMILTPHNKAGHRNVSVAGIHKRLKVLQGEVNKLNIPITLYSGTEIFYRDGVVEELEEGTICTLAESKYVLVEFHPMEQFAYIRAAVYELVSNGYVPILAHIERYICLAGHLERISELIDRGALMQVNASTVTGGMGYKNKQQVKKMLKAQLIHFIASDAHDNKKRSPNLADAAGYTSKKYGESYTSELLHSNAMLIIDGE